ncbi:GNAT family N-acetyltransferase [Bacillus sp. Bva_UNVM-123]|uniref:GNAT family N-acetyltransferase n=1 Tax=Bacillus sp. Bva_UNVM-123 TaxID=2829798 RepID=UPI00391FC946
MEIKVMKIEDVEIISKFISQLNNKEKSHIGYCGKDSKEIANSLLNDLSDIKYTDSFVGAYEQNQLIGLLGFDACLENNSAEIWGPFIHEDKWDVVHALWRKMSNLLPSDIRSLSMFPNIKNHNARNFAKYHSFSKQSKQTILTFHQEDKNELADIEMIELSKRDIPAMKKLHNEVFPHTYFNGDQIVHRINSNRKVFILTNQNDLSGYIYVEAEPKFGEGSIEFFAVRESERGKGIGGKLLTVALKWLFTFEKINSITLCVNSSNDKAISLYKKIGFKHVHDLCFLTKEL